MKQDGQSGHDLMIHRPNYNMRRVTYCLVIKVDYNLSEGMYGPRSTSRNQPKCNHFVCNHATCNRLQVDLGIFVTTKPNFNYFGHSHNYDANIGKTLSYWLDGFRFICLISSNNHQISCILKVFYATKVVYFYVCIVHIKYAYVCILFI
jgi:hypothetical protein